MGVVIPFERSRSLGKERELESILIELSEKQVVFDVDPDLLEALGLIEETALSSGAAEAGFIDIALEDEEA
jgi:hypothetical protein